MSYQEKRTVVSMVTGALVLAAYFVYSFNRINTGVAAADDLKFWAGAILLFIGIGVVASILIQIVFHILLSIGIAVQNKIQNEDCDEQEIEKTINAEMVEDEMDKLIELKSMRIGFVFAGVGFVAGLVSLVLDSSPVVMLNILFGSFWIGSLFEGFTQLYFYRKGIVHG